MISQITNRIIAHRGCWIGETGFEKLPQNSLDSLELALTSGFGIEIDIRDQNGIVFVSHDPILDKDYCLKFEMILEKISDQLIALNVKSDGLINLIDQKVFENLKKKNHFFFDLSFPEEIKYKKMNQVVAKRVSEFESLDYKSNDNPQEFYWLDSFISDWWINEELLLRLLESKSKVILVSPELHGRDPNQAWHYLSQIWSSYDNLMVCSDYPFKLHEILTR